MMPSAVVRPEPAAAPCSTHLYSILNRADQRLQVKVGRELSVPGNSETGTSTSLARPESRKTGYMRLCESTRGRGSSSSGFFLGSLHDHPASLFCSLLPPFSRGNYGVAGPLCPSEFYPAGRGGRVKTEHVRDHRRRHLTRKLDQCCVACRIALDADPGKPHAQIVGVLVATSLPAWEQPIGLLERSGDADLATPGKLAKESIEWLGHPDRVFAETKEDFAV